jgi:hypothetical protein
MEALLASVVTVGLFIRLVVVVITMVEIISFLAALVFDIVEMMLSSVVQGCIWVFKRFK